MTSVVPPLHSFFMVREEEDGDGASHRWGGGRRGNSREGWRCLLTKTTFFCFFTVSTIDRTKSLCIILSKYGLDSSVFLVNLREAKPCTLLRFPLSLSPLFFLSFLIIIFFNGLLFKGELQHSGREKKNYKNIGGACDSVMGCSVQV
ncbi:hypothetical protein CsSME_00035571 [Camellia sinensis var. sinensis]